TDLKNDMKVKKSLKNIKINKKNKQVKKINTNIQPKKLKQTKNKLTYIVLGILLGLGILLNVMPTSSVSNSNDNVINDEDILEESFNENKTDVIKENELETDEKFKEKLLIAYRQSLLGKQQEAIKLMEEIG